MRICLSNTCARRKIRGHLSLRTSHFVMKPSTRRIIWTDWPALASTWGMPLCWVASFGVPYAYTFRGAQPYDPLPLSFPTAVTAILAGVLFWRINRIRSLFQRGHVTKGIITGIWIVKDRGRLEYAYEFNGRQWHAWSSVHKNQTVLSLVENQTVDVLVDVVRPTNAIVRDIYTARKAGSSSVG